MSRYKAYPAYKDSGVEWLGEIPSHWETNRLKRIISKLESGVSVNASDTPAEDGEIGVLKTSCVYTRSFRPSENKQVVPQELNRVKCTVKKGAIIISRMNTPELFGASALVECDAKNLYLPDRLWQTESLNLSSKFVASFMMIDQFRSQISLAAEGASSSMQNIAKEDYLAIHIAHPISRAEQKKIASFLDHETAKIDALIEKQQRLIELLKEKRQAVISHAVTKGLNPNAPMKDSGVEWLGEVPAHWLVRRLKHSAALQSGIPKGKDLAGRLTMDVPMLRVANVQDGYLDLTEVHLIQIEPLDIERYSLKYGDVLMNEGGDNDKLGRGAVWRSEITPCIHQNHVFAIRPIEVEPEWLDLVTRASYAKFHFYRVAKQSTNLASISSTNIKETPLLIPPEEERAEIISYVDRQLKKFELLEQKSRLQIELIQERRTALISAAVTGKIDVRDWQAAA